MLSEPSVGSLSPRDLLKIQRLSLGSPKISNFWGEEKWRQAKLVASFILQAHFDEAPFSKL